MRGKVHVLQQTLLGAGRWSKPIPFVSTPFSFDLMLFLALWPLWWILGVEQILLPFFAAWETARCLWQARGRFALTAPVVWAGLLALWWLVPALWLNREYVDIFVKEAATAWSQVFMLFLFWNAVRSPREWRQAARGLTVMAAYLALGGLLFALGVARGTVTSALGMIAPGLTDSSSTFFRSISVRGLGQMGTDTVLLPFRLRSFTLHPTYLSMVSLLLIPYIAWRMYEAKRLVRVLLGVVLAGLLLCLVGTDSRVAYLAFGAGLLALAVHALRPWRTPARGAVFAGMVILLLVAVVIASGGLGELWQKVVVEWRPGSLAVRSRVYAETLRLLPEHPIAGWGIQQRIPGLRTSFSAGSHSSVLAMWFQHGVVGLAFYIGLWVSIWRRVFGGLKSSASPSSMRPFWVAAAISFLCFNIRELADAWWWDQTLAMTLWTVWGLALTVPRAQPSPRSCQARVPAPARASVLGVWVDGFDMDSLNHAIAGLIEAGDHKIVANANVHCLNLTYKNPWLRDFLNEAYIVFCDGAGVVLGARILGCRLPGRITPADWILSLAEFAAGRGFSFYFLGGRPGVAEKAAAHLRERFPNLRIVGVHHGYFDKTPGSTENEAVVQRINAAKPNILFVGFGMPLQEQWLKENWSRLGANVALPCGALFDYVSGELRRSPKWLNDHGLEWLGRLIIEPRRLWRRYLIGNPLFLWRVLKQRLRQEMTLNGQAPHEGESG